MDRLVRRDRSVHVAHQGRASHRRGRRLPTGARRLPTGRDKHRIASAVYDAHPCGGHASSPSASTASGEKAFFAALRRARVEVFCDLRRPTRPARARSTPSRTAG
jgi:hypothetical protein